MIGWLWYIVMPATLRTFILLSICIWKTNFLHITSYNVFGKETCWLSVPLLLQWTFLQSNNRIPFIVLFVEGRAAGIIWHWFTHTCRIFIAWNLERKLIGSPGQTNLHLLLGEETFWVRAQRQCLLIAVNFWTNVWDLILCFCSKRNRSSFMGY